MEGDLFKKANVAYLNFKDIMKDKAEKHISKFGLTVRDGDSSYYFFTALASVLDYIPEDLKTLTYEDVIKSIEISIKTENGLGDRWVDNSRVGVADNGQLTILDDYHKEVLTDIVNVVHNDDVAICFGTNSYMALTKVDNKGEIIKEKIYYVD